MALYNFHRILIAAAILFDVGYTFFALRRWNIHHQGIDLFMAIATTVVSVMFIAYLMYFNRKTRAIKRVLAGQPICLKCGHDLSTTLDKGEETCPSCGAPVPQRYLEHAA